MLLSQDNLYLFRGLAILALWSGCLGIRHLLVLCVRGLLGLRRLAGLILSLALCLDALLFGESLGLDLLEVSLYDGARESTNLIDLGDVDPLRCVVTLII